ncbi:hypothetical protein Sru01_03070 [Sphaerisporangium rufum]|uniref:Uncharacterized protein n=1 Tax=Sphaerisporangium rufum TaxID=1381558 RepID=A0A919QYU2_9ACTN|nr:hypothetical protein Sru01_03070 [Sphaerisporangium rufum]
MPGEAFTARTSRAAGPVRSARAHTVTTASAIPGAKKVQARGSQVFMYGR